MEAQWIIIEEGVDIGSLKFLKNEKSLVFLQGFLIPDISGFKKKKGDDLLSQVLSKYHQRWRA